MSMPEAATVTPHEVLVENIAEERVSVASNWTLVWWRFKKHRLALICGALLIFMYIIVLVPDFFATENPEFTEAYQSFIPPQPLHLFDGASLSPWVPAVVGKRNAVTLRMEWQIDASKKIPVQFFVKGYPYKIFGLIETDTHLIGPASSNAKDRLSLLGTDRLGRDQWSRLMFATRTSLTIGMIAVLMSTVLGVRLGGGSGYFGGVLDTIIQRVIELLQSLPTIPIWLALSAALPQDWRPEQVFFAITIILSLIGWTTLAPEVRRRFLGLPENNFR